MFYLKYFVPLNFLIVTILSVTNNKDHGPFDLKVLSCDIFTSNQYAKVLIANELKCESVNGILSTYVNITITKTLGYLGVTMKTYQWQEKNKKYVLAVRKAAKNMCKDSMTQMLTMWIPNFNKDCRVLAGTYAMNITDINRFIQTFTQGIFFYGKYQVITDLQVSGQGRVIRTNATGIITPKQ